MNTKYLPTITVFLIIYVEFQWPINFQSQKAKCKFRTIIIALIYIIQKISTPDTAESF